MEKISTESKEFNSKNNKNIYSTKIVVWYFFLLY